MKSFVAMLQAGFRLIKHDAGARRSHVVTLSEDCRVISWTPAAGAPALGSYYVGGFRVAELPGGHGDACFALSFPAAVYVPGVVKPEKALVVFETVNAATRELLMSRRRLSGGAALLAPGLDDGSSDEEAAPAPKLANKNRRRSGARRSFGGRKSGGGKGKPIEDLSPEDVAAMYSTTLKMAAVDDRENKITAKNAWSLPLIDHMRDVVREEDEGGDEGKKNPKHNKPRKIFNFTRASCTLEAGVKIYSSRVDDTLNTSVPRAREPHRGKTKGGESDDDESEDEDDAPLEGEEAAPKKRKARKAATHAGASRRRRTSAQIDAVASRRTTRRVLLAHLARRRRLGPRLPAPGGAPARVADAAAGGDAGAYPAGDDGHDDGGDAPAFFGGDDDGDDDYPDVDDDCGLGDEGIENTLVDAFALGGGALGRPALAAGEAQRPVAVTIFERF
ncbi:condensin complex subunit 2 [Aureococcus anophagefferens]|nr:condensin complex subunit 2 [Aureococcus anophagefferens]